MKKVLSIDESIGAAGWRESGATDDESTREADPSTEVFELEGRRIHSTARCQRTGEKAGREASAGVHVDLAGLGLTRDQSLPRLVALVNDLGRVLAVLGLAREGELYQRHASGFVPGSSIARRLGAHLVLGLSVGDFVDAGER